MRKYPERITSTYIQDALLHFKEDFSNGRDILLGNLQREHVTVSEIIADASTTVAVGLIVGAATGALIGILQTGLTKLSASPIEFVTTALIGGAGGAAEYTATFGRNRRARPRSL